MSPSVSPVPASAQPGPGTDLPPRFSDVEFARRREALAALVDEAGVDQVLLYGANRAGSAVQWLTGWPVTREAAVVHTPGRADSLLVHFFNHVPQARRLARDADVRWAGSSTARTVAEELALRGGAGRVGVIGALPFGMADALRAGGSELVDLTGGYTRLRLRKSPEELDWIRRAAALTDRSCTALQEGARPGTTEHELNALVEGGYVAEGGGTYIHYFAVTAMGRPGQCVPAQWPSGRRLAVGDVLSCELSASWGVDYPGQLLRTFTVGADPTPLVQELHAVADEALGRIEALLAPGVAAEEVVTAAEVIEEAGFTTVDDLVHGLGGGYLPPVFGSRSRTLEPLPELRFAEGMTVVVQPNVTTLDGSLGVQTGELLLVTADGCRRLHHFPRGLGRIA